MEPSFKGRWFRHFKGGYYKVIAIPKSSEDQSQDIVVYEDKKGNQWWRDREEFLGDTEDGKKRFVLLPTLLGHIEECDVCDRATSLNKYCNEGRELFSLG